MTFPRMEKVLGQDQLSVFDKLERVLYIVCILSVMAACAIFSIEVFLGKLNYEINIKVYRPDVETEESSGESWQPKQILFNPDSPHESYFQKIHRDRDWGDHHDHHHHDYGNYRYRHDYPYNDRYYSPYDPYSPRDYYYEVPRRRHFKLCPPTGGCIEWEL